MKMIPRRSAPWYNSTIRRWSIRADNLMPSAPYIPVFFYHPNRAECVRKSRACCAAWERVKWDENECCSDSDMNILAKVSTGGGGT